MPEAFSFTKSISEIPGFQAAWIPRLSGISVNLDRAEALANLEGTHQEIIEKTFPEKVALHKAEQVHGNQVQEISASNRGEHFHSGVDGLITNLRDEVLAIYVADCAAIYLADPVTGAIGLLHSGKKGTETNILRKAVTEMQKAYETDPSNLICVVSPCIRPPLYEIDFASTIEKQAEECGIGTFHDCGENTAENLERHYSYRMEKGKTGRMLALLSLV